MTLHSRTVRLFTSFKDAERLYGWVVADNEKCFGPEHSESSILRTLSGLAVIYLYIEAEALHE